MPSLSASRGEPNATGRPFSRTRPESGRSRPVTILINVDLPAPFSPIRAWISPAFRSSETPSSACTPGKDLLTDSIASSISGRLALDRPPAVQADRGENEGAEHELDPIGIDLREHHAVLNQPQQQDREHGAEHGDVAASQRRAADDRRGEGKQQPIGANGGLRRPELRDRQHGGGAGEQTGQNVSGYDDALAGDAGQFRGVGIAAEGQELAPLRGAREEHAEPHGYDQRRNEEIGDRAQMSIAEGDQRGRHFVERYRSGNAEIDSCKSGCGRQRYDESVDARAHS